MASVTVHQLQSKETGKKAFLNVDEEYGYVDVWGSLYERETYLLFVKGSNSNEFHLVQFSPDASQESIREFFADKQGTYRIVKIEKESFVTEVAATE